MEKTKVGLLYGGKSPEHNISLLSAQNVFKNIDTNKYEVVLLPIDKSGNWHWQEGREMQLSNPTDAAMISLPHYDDEVYLDHNPGKGNIISKKTGKIIAKIDLLYPILHGTYGEDGSIQGMAKMANLPCVGCSTLGSAIGMDKDVTKRLLKNSGINVADFITLRKGYNDHISYEEVSVKLGKELFIKPANLGSSVGISYVTDKKSFDKAVKMGFEYDPKVVIEEKIEGREIECAVIGNQNPKASVIGELGKTEWYSFEKKYINTDGISLIIPADIAQELSNKARKLALDTYINLECCGLTRVDIFLQKDGKMIVNEVNTSPGFTNNSMYPKLWEHSGLPYKELVSELIKLAIERNNFELGLKTTHN
ncbi:MAG: D-alanine--D-alanine ligase family protein [Saprospiraceae bacterium]